MNLRLFRPNNSKKNYACELSRIDQIDHTLHPHKFTKKDFSGISIFLFFSSEVEYFLNKTIPSKIAALFPYPLHQRNFNSILIVF